MKSLHPTLSGPLAGPLFSLHHHRNRLQSWLHTKPDTSHLLFSHHTRCSPTPSSMMMPHSVRHPFLYLSLSLSHAVVICVSDCTEQEWHTCMQLQGSAQACQSRDRQPLGSLELQRGWRPAKCNSILQQRFFLQPALPGARQEELGKHLCTHTHSHTEPICIQVQSHTSTHSGTLTDTHSTPPKSHQTVRLLN